VYSPATSPGITGGNSLVLNNTDATFNVQNMYLASNNSSTVTLFLGFGATGNRQTIINLCGTTNCNSFGGNDATIYREAGINGRLLLNNVTGNGPVLIGAQGGNAISVNQGATGITFLNYGTGVLQSNGSGVISSAAVAVAQGGTGAATFTSNGVLYGNGTGAVQVTAQGAANSVLIANAGAPSFSATPTLTSLALNAAANTGLTITVTGGGSTALLTATNSTNGRTVNIGILDGFNGGFNTLTGEVLLQIAGSTWLDIGNSGTTSVFATGNVKVNSAIASSSKTTGSGIFGGGVGIAGALFTDTINVISMAQTSAAQSGTVCYASGTGLLTYDATLGCLASTLDVKDDWTDIAPSECFSKVVAMKAGSFKYKTGMGLPAGEQVGFNAQQMATVDERLVARDTNGKLLGVRYQQASALYACALQAVKADNDNLRVEIRQLKTVTR
jgi:hypothetical protein